MKTIYLAAALSVLAGAPATTQAQTMMAATAPLATPGVTTVRVPRGARWTIPLAGVTRVVPADDDVVRGSFSGTMAALEGVTNGETLVEVYQGANRRQVYAVLVEDPIAGGAMSASTTTTTTVSTPVAIAAVPPAGTPVTAVAPNGAISNSEVAIAPNTPVVVAANTNPAGEPSVALPPVAPAPVAGQSNLQISMRYAPVLDNPAQSLFTITYSNRSNIAARGVILRSALDDVVSYVTGSATNDGRYDAATREILWNIGTVEAGAVGRTVSFRIEPVDSKPTTFYSVATVEDATGTSRSSNPIKMGTGGAPLLTVFALPDRFLAGRNAAVLADVKGVDYQRAIDRLQAMGVVDGRGANRYYPADATQRAEYAVMTLRGLNLKDLRDVTAIKFVLGRRSTVSLNVVNSAGRVVASLLKGQQFDAGEKTVIWDGRAGSGYAAPGLYRYVCTARDASGQTTTLGGKLTIVPQTPVEPSGTSSFVDVRPTDWYAGYLALAQNQNLVQGYGDKTFKPTRAISRVEATAVVVRALGLEDLARQMQDQSVGFLDGQNIPRWANGYVNVAATVAKTRTGKVIAGYPSNFFMPLNPLRRDEAALMVQRLIDKETTRRVAVSGQLAPGASVTINSRTVESNDDGEFSFVIEQNTADPTSIAVLGNAR